MKYNARDPMTIFTEKTRGRVFRCWESRFPAQGVALGREECNKHPGQLGQGAESAMPAVFPSF